MKANPGPGAADGGFASRIKASSQCDVADHHGLGAGDCATAAQSLARVFNITPR